MARVLGLFPAALNAARSGASANAFYRELQAEGIAPRRAEALQLYKVARNVVANSEEEVFRPTGAIPTGSEIAPWPTRTSSGIGQNVLVTLRDRTTGVVTAKPITVKTESGITRQEAIARAISLTSENSDAYNQEIVGAVHVATYEFSPDLLEQ